MEAYAIFHIESGRQITRAYENAADMAAEGYERGVVTRDTYGWPQLRKGYERRRAAKPHGMMPKTKRSAGDE